MKSKYAWLLLPPLMAFIIFMGPMKSSDNSPVKANSAQEAPVAKSAIGSKLPETPSLWQIGTSLAGILLVGVAGIMLFARFKGQGGVTVNGDYLTLRQTLRLNAKQKIYAVECEDQVLLLGESDNNLCVLNARPNRQLVEDAEEVFNREDELDEGAVPRDMIIPRMAPKPRQQKSSASLSDFKTLLKRSRNKVQV